MSCVIRMYSKHSPLFRLGLPLFHAFLSHSFFPFLCSSLPPCPLPPRSASPPSFSLVLHSYFLDLFCPRALRAVLISRCSHASASHLFLPLSMFRGLICSPPISSRAGYPPSASCGAGVTSAVCISIRMGVGLVFGRFKAARPTYPFPSTQPRWYGLGSSS